MKHVLDYCEKDGNIDSIYLHVQVNNDVALAFYNKFNFEVLERKEQYYKRIEPSDAFVLSKKIEKTKSLSVNHHNKEDK